MKIGLTLLTILTSLLTFGQTTEFVILGGIQDSNPNINNTLFDAIYLPNNLNGLGTITIKGNLTIKGNFTIPEGIELNFFKGNKLIIESGVELTINGSINAGVYQIFDGDGTITGFPKITETYPEWFGAKVNDEIDDTIAIQKAINFSNTPIKLAEGTYITKTTLKKERTIENDEGVKIIGIGISSTIIKVLHEGNFIEIKGFNGLNSETTSGKQHRPIQGNLLKNFTVDGRRVAKNGVYFYASRYNDLSNIKIRNFKENGIVFDGNPDINPDLTASIFTKIEHSQIEYNKVGIFNLINNNSPILYLSNSFIVDNFRAGVIWNSSYFHSSESSISFNGTSIRDNPNINNTDDFPLGGFYNAVQNNYGDNKFFGVYVSKGIVLETTEFDGNYPSSITLKSSNGALIANNSIQMTDQYYENFDFSNKGLIAIGGENLNINNKTEYQRSRNTVIENNRISYKKSKDQSIIQNNACIIKLTKWALYTKIMNNCFTDHTAYPSNVKNSSGLGIDYKYIKEFSRADENWYNDEDSYLKLFDNECISSDIEKDNNGNDFKRIDIASDLYLSKFNKINSRDFGKRFKNGDFVTIDVPTIKQKNGVEVKGGSFVISSNDPNSVSGLFFYRADNNPQILAAYSSPRLSFRTLDSSTADVPGNLNIIISNNGQIHMKSLLPNDIFINITFIERIGMYDN
ncbi:hypothetical protein ABW636_10240 [Aquimarina sp. 2201CG1-2-11]|uniref:hypothetical protein n=1 Tax=Aquimarina discodermiae TaxID=3231043 RepID=UPI003461F11E